MLTKQKLLELEPMAMLGYGIVSYMQLLQFLQWVFVILTLLNLPALYIYSQGTSYKENSENFLGGYDTWMLGNLGYSSVNCDSAPTSVGFIGLQCNYGTVGQIFDFGFHERNDEDTYEMCINDENMAPCKPDNKHFIAELNNSRGKEQFSMKL